MPRISAAILLHNSVGIVVVSTALTMLLFRERALEQLKNGFNRRPGRSRAAQPVMNGFMIGAFSVSSDAI
jgi:hypothetical protein